MKKQLSLIALLMLFALLKGNSQKEWVQAEDNKVNIQEATTNSWPPLNAEWYYELQPLGGSFPSIVSYQYTKIVGDTLLQSKNCKILRRINAINICESMGREFEYIYKSNDTVFWYNQDSKKFTILYNFAAEAGDKWEISVRDCSFIVNVDSVNTVVLNSKNHKVLYVSDADNYFTGKIIEGVGHTKSFFPKDIYWYCRGVACDSDVIDGIRCFLLNDTLVFHWDSTPCDTTYQLFTDLTDNQLNKIINICPNPFADQLYIRSNNDIENLRLDVYDLMGRLIHSEVVPNYLNPYTTKTFSNLKPGNYFLLITTKHKQPWKQIITKM